MKKFGRVTEPQCNRDVRLVWVIWERRSDRAGGRGVSVREVEAALHLAAPMVSHAIGVVGPVSSPNRRRFTEASPIDACDATGPSALERRTPSLMA
jgi:hypothetical protein